MTSSQTTVTPPPKPPGPKPRWSILDVGPIALLIATLAGSCGAWHWTFDLASHFRGYYFLLGLFWLIRTCRQKHRLLQGCLGVTLAWNGALMLPYYLPVSQLTVPTGVTQVSLVSLNVYTANQNKSAVLNYLRRRDADLVIVMEVDVNWSIAMEELKDLYPHRLMQPREDNFGIGLLSKWPFQDSRLIELAGTEVPNVVAQFERDGRQFQVIGTHPLPPVSAERTRERNAQLLEVADLARQSTVPCIVAGDFNATPWSVAFRQFATRSGLRDTSLGRGMQGSWNAKSWLMRIPIDHVFVPPKAIVTHRAVGPNVGSDHFPVEAVIALP